MVVIDGFPNSTHTHTQTYAKLLLENCGKNQIKWKIKFFKIPTKTKTTRKNKKKTYRRILTWKYVDDDKVDIFSRLVSVKKTKTLN